MTEFSDFQGKIRTLLPEIEIRFAEPMAKHTSFRIGGDVWAMAFPKSSEEISRCLKAGRTLGVPCYILGAGTNVLAPDEGMAALVLCLKDALDGLERLDETGIRVAAGVTMTRAAMFAANQGLSGLEFAHGIPGTVGGGVYMNAGAYGGEIGSVCTRVKVLDPDGTIREYSAEEMDFSYRHSALEDRGGIVLEAEFALTPGDPEEIKEKQRALLRRRSASQPLNLPSAGSAFKRPAGGYAAKLIDEAGLRGFAIGGAQVSEKHTGFVVNTGNATAAQVRQLLKAVADKVAQTSGISLEPEVRIW